MLRQSRRFAGAHARPLGRALLTLRAGCKQRARTRCGIIWHNSERMGEAAIVTSASQHEESTPAEARFERLYAEHASRVFGLCLRMTGDRTRATELAQDVFVHIWHNLSQLRDDRRDTGGWVWRVAVNVVRNQLRGDRRRRARFETAEDPLSLAPPAVPNTPLPIRRMDLRTAIATLPDRARSVYLLHDVEGYSHEEISRMLGIAEATVRVQLHRARRQLRGVLAP